MIALSLRAGTLRAQPVDVRVDVRVDARVELVSALFRAAGREEYGLGRVPRFNTSVDSLMARHTTHDAVAWTRRLAGQYNVGYFAPISLAIHLQRAPDLSLGVGLATAPSLHRTWKNLPDSTAAVVTAFAAFDRDVRFAAFLREQRPVVDAAESGLRALVAGVSIQWIRAFWGDTTLGRVTISPGLLSGGASYGLDVVHPDGHREGHAVIGVRRVDASGLPMYDSTDVATLLHEIHHPFLTGALRGAPPALRQVADSLYRGSVTAMRRLGYGSGDAMLNEAVVRAAVIRYLAANGAPGAAERELRAQQDEGFTWISAVVDALAEYEGRRHLYPSFSSFGPVLVERLRAIEK